MYLLALAIPLLLFIVGMNLETSIHDRRNRN